MLEVHKIIMVSKLVVFVNCLFCFMSEIADRSVESYKE